jgi:hypothetical protein
VVGPPHTHGIPTLGEELTDPHSHVDDAHHRSFPRL